MKKKEYYKIETVRILLFPFVLLLIGWFFISQGWVSAEEAGIVWKVLLIYALAGLATIGVYYLFAEKK